MASYWRRLPIPLPPAQHETIASWLHRLATVHGLPGPELRQHLRVGTRGGDMDEVGHGLRRRLAAVAGHPVEALVWAVPELRAPATDWPALRHLAQRACPRCTVRHEGGPVRRLFAHQDYVCVRHGYWIGPPDPTRDDPPPRLVAAVPELRAAQRRLDRAERRHGWAATFDATAAATRICIDLRFSAEAHPLWNRWERRLDLLTPAGYRRSLFMAAIFPEVAALTEVLAAPGCRTRAARGEPADGDAVVRAAQHALDCADPPHRHDLSDALLGWIDTGAARTRLQPAATYPDTGHHDDGTARVTDQYRLAEHLTAVQFQRDRRAPRTHHPAAPMPYAHRPTPASIGTASTPTAKMGRTS